MDRLQFKNYFFFLFVKFFLKIYFLMWTIFKVFIEFVTILLLFYFYLFFKFFGFVGSSLLCMGFLQLQ